MESEANTFPYDLPADAVWFVTGCSSGIGKSLAESLLSHPTYRVVATARKPSTLSDLAGTAGAESRLLVTPLDVTSTESIDAAVAATLSHFGRIDVLINNAGYGFFCDAEASLAEQERAQFDTNFWGPVALCKLAVRVMREENPKTGSIGGVIINVSSMGGFIAVPWQAFYHASKFALEGFTQSIAKEMRPEWNIHFCIAEPGGIQTDFKGNITCSPPHPAYSAPDTPSRKMEAFWRNASVPKTWAMPDPTARAIIEIVTGASQSGKGRIPIRIPIGLDSYTIIKAELAKIAGDLEEFKDLAISTHEEDIGFEMKEILGLT